MKTLHTCFQQGRFPEKPEEGEIGIEIETEVLSFKDYNGTIIPEDDGDGNPWWNIPESKSWKGVYDGSLRNYGVEYVLTKPLGFLDAIAALDEFGKIFKDVPFLKDQPGTSVHVHLNFLNKRLVDIANFVTVFTLFENLLTEFAGAGRRSNLFARPHRVADGQVSNIISMFKQMEAGNQRAVSWSDNQTKYANLNIATLGRLGSLEIRCFRGTTDISVIQDWVSILYELYEYACSLSSPMEFYRRYQERLDKIVEEVFPGSFELLTKPLYWQGLVHTNEFYMAKYALAVRDWGRLDENYKDVRRPSRKKMTIEDALQMAQAPQPVIQQTFQVLGNIQPTTVLIDDSASYSGLGSDSSW